MLQKDKMFLKKTVKVEQFSFRIVKQQKSMSVYPLPTGHYCQLVAYTSLHICFYRLCHILFTNRETSICRLEYTFTAVTVHQQIVSPIYK